MQRIIPPKLKPGDTIRVIAPSYALAMNDKEILNIALKRFQNLGLKVTFGKHVNDEMDAFHSTSVSARLEDLMDAFKSPEIKMVIAYEGGFNSNQLLAQIDWNLIKNNPRIVIGYSDITALTTAIFAKTGIVTYSGSNYSGFGEKERFDYTLDYFQKCLMDTEAFSINPSEKWSDDDWWENNENREFFNNDGFLPIHEGKTEGIILGGNLQTFALLKGTDYFPDLTNAILFLEDDQEEDAEHIDCLLQSVILEKSFKGVKGLVLGKLKRASKLPNNLLVKIVNTKAELKNIPVIAGVNFGHTRPIITFPIGGTVKLNVTKENSSIEIEEH